MTPALATAQAASLGAMQRPVGWQGEAFNPVPDSDNRIHSDEVAREHGFEGALVPGVTVTAYVCQPAVLAWGMDWLARGRGRVVVHKPLYDRRAFEVRVTGKTPLAYDAELVDARGTLCATGTIELPDQPATPPVFRGDPLVTGDRVPATREGLEALRGRAMGAIRVPWGEGTDMRSYLRDPDSMPELLRPAGGGYANTSFALGLTNYALAASVALGPWLHLEARFQHFAPIPRGSEVTVEARVADLFAKKGHEFVDVDVGVFLGPGRPALSATMRAIYRLRMA
jgi:hypothetical protein